MAYTKKKRPYKKEYQQQKARKSEHERRMERQRARRKIDKTGKDANKNGVADKREGKDVSHRKALSKEIPLKSQYLKQVQEKERKKLKKLDI